MEESDRTTVIVSPVWSAGIFEASGNVIITCSEGSGRNSPNHCLVAQVHSTNDELLRILWDNYGGTISGDKWMLTAEDALTFLRAMSHNIKSKIVADMIDIGITFQEVKVSFRGHKQVPPEELQKRWYYYNQLMELKTNA